MKSFANYLITFFLILFFVFRLVVVYLTTANIDFLIISNNIDNEIIFLFIMFFSIVLIIKNKVLGSIVLFVSTIWCYGGTVYTFFANNLVTSQDIVLQFLSAFVGIFLSFMSLVILILQKKQEINPVNKKTDFFYKNENYDRKIDERADKNNYRTM